MTHPKIDVHANSGRGGVRNSGADELTYDDVLWQWCGVLVTLTR